MRIRKLVFAISYLFLAMGTVAQASTTVFHNQATVILKAGQIGRYVSAALKYNVMDLTRKEPGNISYVAFHSVQDARIVIFDEVWKSEADLGTHLATPHMQSFFKSIRFDPSLYDVAQQGSTTTFTIKPGTSDYVIEKLTLFGFQAKILK